MPEKEQLLVILHDGSFPGFLCALGDAMNLRSARGGRPQLRDTGDAIGLFEESSLSRRDDTRAESILTRFRQRLGDGFCQALLEACAAATAGARAAAAAVAMRAWTEGIGVLDDLSDPDAALFEKASKRSRMEANLCAGTIRFSELADGSWYAPLAPDCDVLALIAEHFTERFPGMNWIIHDTNRSTALLHESGRGCALVRGFTLDSAPELAPGELGVRRAWRGYHRAVAISERENPKLQNTHLPRKYRLYMTEFMEDEASALPSATSPVSP